MEVINIRKKELNKLGYRDLEHWLENPNHIYIGRYNPYVKGTYNSKWRNRFSVNKYGRLGCIRMFRSYIKKDDQLLNDIHELDNKVLGCWCKPKACHGNILIQLLKDTKDNEK
jgi:hypothetical protein